MRVKLDMELNYEDRLETINKIIEEGSHTNDYLLELFANYLLTAKDKENHRKLDYSFYLNIDKSIENSTDTPFQDYMAPYQDIWEDLTEEQVNDRISLSERTREQIREIFDKLSPRERQCYLLNRVEGFTQQKIADNLEISVKTVGVHVINAQDKIDRIIRK